MFHRRFGTGVSGVKRREGAEQRGDQRADFTVVVEVFARLFQEEERGFGVDRRHLVVLGFADVDHRLFQHFADGIDGDIRPADGGDRIGEQLFDRARGGEIGLQRDALRPGGLNGGDGFFRFGLGSGAVVVDHHRFGALFSQIACDQPAEVLRRRR